MYQHAIPFYCWIISCWRDGPHWFFWISPSPDGFSILSLHWVTDFTLKAVKPLFIYLWIKSLRKPARTGGEGLRGAFARLRIVQKQSLKTCTGSLQRQWYWRNLVSCMLKNKKKDPEAHFCSSFHPLYQLLFMWCFSLKLSSLMISPSAPSICSSTSFLPFWSKSLMTSVCQVLGDTSLLSEGSGALTPPHQSTSWFLWPHFLPWPPPFLLCSTSEVGVPLGSGLSFVLVYQSVFTQLHDSWWSEASAIRIFLISVLLGLYV